MTNKKGNFGLCSVCDKRFSRAGMSRHLSSCLLAHKSGGGRPQQLLHLRVEARDSELYWLNLEVKAAAGLDHLDAYLRQLWLECCGHLSSFCIDGEYFSSSLDPDPMFRSTGERAMSGQSVGRFMAPGTSLSYDYDFGSTTSLLLRVIGRRAGRIGSEPIRLLARNEAPSWTCGQCDEPANSVCPQCVWESGAEAFVCDKHEEDHACGEDMLLPTVNSPRMGVCAYGDVW